MARRLRLIRVFGKKRGDRRTGSQRLGSYGEALFFGVFIVIGGIGFYLLLARLIWPEWRANLRFERAQCVVLDKRLGQADVEGTMLYRPEVLIRYEIDGQPRAEWTYDVNQVYEYGRDEAQAILDELKIGKTYECWYDPTTPSENALAERSRVVLVRGYSWWLWLLLILPASFFVIGLVGAIRSLLQSGISAERRAALARSARIDLFEDAPKNGAVDPALPSTAAITDSPGTRLAYRLPTDVRPTWTLAGILAMAIAWNAVVVWFTVLNVRNHVGGNHDWLMSVLLVPLIAVGVGLLIFGVKQVMFTTGSGATRLEISAHPLFIGGTYDIFFSQSGRTNIRSLQIALVCDEVATFRQGTNNRTETQRVYDETIYERDALQVQDGASFEDACEFQVPHVAMHSFQSAHNGIEWKLQVTGKINDRRDYERCFPIVIYPHQDGDRK